MSGDERVDGEGWRRGYDDWKADAPDTGRDLPQPPTSCKVCGASCPPPLFRCINGHTAREQDAAVNARRDRLCRELSGK